MAIKIEKDLTKAITISIRESNVELLKKEAQKHNISVSKLADLIVEDYFKKGEL